MVDRRWVPLGIRIVGLYFVGASLQGILRALGEVAKWYQFSKGTENPESIWPFIAIAVASLVQLLLGVALLVKATSLARRWVGDANKKCPACLADASQSQGGTCTHCGAMIKPASNT
ncbi:MAG: hypothetical protein U0640_11995 [Phycisphaerales bacterium]